MHLGVGGRDFIQKYVCVIILLSLLSHGEQVILKFTYHCLMKKALHDHTVCAWLVSELNVTLGWQGGGVVGAETPV